MASTPARTFAIFTLCAMFMVLALAEADIALEWAVVGDSWASGVAYNLSNVYERTDNEYCYRSKEAWGAQMARDTSWTLDPQVFQFAACGGTLMDDLDRQMREKAGYPDIVWGMFGGNNALFGAIARACIYQPIDLNHPLGWGPAWDEDPDGTGYCKRNIQKAAKYLDDSGSEGMRAAFEQAVDDILTVAQNQQALNQPFDLYVSSYVRFFNDTTDGCDDWSFGHDQLSTGKPKLVKGLRAVINDKVQQLNSIQADVIKNYKIPDHTPFNPNFRVHNSQPDSIFDGHRFCEADHTFEDQYYNQDVWLWNLQYNDEKTGDEVGVVTTNNSVKFMAPPNGLDITQGFSTVLGADNSPNASIPQDYDLNTTQYGFGWTARPFHPKFVGHTALKDFFIQQMRDDDIPGIKPASSVPSQPSSQTSSQDSSQTLVQISSQTPPIPSPSPRPSIVCNGLGSGKYVTRDIVKDVIQDQVCPDAVSKGSVQGIYNPGTPEEVVITVQGPDDFRPSMDDCTNHLLSAIIDGCDGNNPQNPANYKGGGTNTIGDIVYTIEPQAPRQSADAGIQYRCDSSYKVVFNEYTVWGHGFDSVDHGDGLKKQLGGCALLPKTWSFDYGLGSDGREWTAKFRTGVFQRKCVGNAVKSAGAPNSVCSGSG